jgi:hypothetical protein
MVEHTPWVGNLSLDLRKGALSVSADGLTIIDENGVCWGIVFPDKLGHYDHATAFVRSVNSYDTLVKALEDIKRATIEGRVCDDVAWFDTITTLHDFCDMVLASVNAPVGGNNG